QVDLSAGNIIDQFNTSADVFDIVVTHGYAHAMPRVDQWEKIRSIDLSTGVETLQSGYSVRAGTVMKLH
ncbi:MAG: hypothetical protein GWO23_16450, partial [Gammaproteobacteria bacterium]|nr:hypothetical protein [Gammaproteobacteria bacterium]